MPATSWNTPTMAELYLKQGHTGRALAIYRRLVREHPEDAEAARRLTEIETLAAGQQGELMGFREHIQRIVDGTPGAIACTVMGFDGIAIDSYEVAGAGEIDIPTLLVEYAAATNQLRHSAATQPLAGPIGELVIGANSLTAVLRPLTEEYFLAVVLSPHAYLGKARYLMRVAVPRIMKEILA